MSRDNRRIARSLREAGVIFLLALPFFGMTAPARARTTIVPDDFPTIQAAVDAIPEFAIGETLLVRGGSYPEKVRIDRSMVVLAIPPLDGSDRMPEIGGLVAGGDGERIVFVGLRFTGRATDTSYGPDNLIFTDCRFDVGFGPNSTPGQGLDTNSLQFTGCTFFGTSVVGAWIATMDSCTAYGPVTVAGIDRARVFDNLFEDIPGRALLLALSRDAVVARNRVRGGDNAFEAHPEEGDVRFEDNDIEGCRGWGINSEAWSVEHSFVERNRIAHCGGFGIRVYGSVTARGNLVLDCRGPGIDVDQVDGAGIVEDNVVGRCDVVGIRLADGNYWARSSTVSVRGNTAYSCSGPGIAISGLPGSTIANNLVYACLGLSVTDSDPLFISHNNWFPMLDPPISPSDLSVDPLFCDLAADNVYLRSDSPLLDVPGAGRIGALGQGCEPPPIAVGFDLTPNTLNLASRGRWVTGVLEPALPFGVGDIDITTVRLNGIVPVDPFAPTALADQDGDGIADLMVKFDRAAVELTLSEGEDVPITVTFEADGRTFAGTDHVRVRRGHVSTPLPGERLVAGSVVPVRWESPGGGQVRSIALMLSTDGGATWSQAPGSQSNRESLDWTVPDIRTDEARLAVVSIGTDESNGEHADAVLAKSGNFSIGATTGVGDRGEGTQVLAIRSVAPNPAAHVSLRVEFVLRDGSPAQLELLDVAGRVLGTRHLASLGPGRHALELSEAAAQRPGIYFLRLRQGGSEVRARAAITR